MDMRGCRPGIHKSRKTQNGVLKININSVDICRYESIYRRLRRSAARAMQCFNIETNTVQDYPKLRYVQGTNI